MCENKDLDSLTKKVVEQNLALYTVTKKLSALITVLIFLTLSNFSVTGIGIFIYLS